MTQDVSRIEVIDMTDGDNNDKVSLNLADILDFGSDDDNTQTVTHDGASRAESSSSFAATISSGSNDDNVDLPRGQIERRGRRARVARPDTWIPASISPSAVSPTTSMPTMTAADPGGSASNFDASSYVAIQQGLDVI